MITAIDFHQSFRKNISCDRDRAGDILFGQRWMDEKNKTRFVQLMRYWQGKWWTKSFEFLFQIDFATAAASAGNASVGEFSDNTVTREFRM